MLFAGKTILQKKYNPLRNASFAYKVICLPLSVELSSEVDERSRRAGFTEGRRAHFDFRDLLSSSDSV